MSLSQKDELKICGVKTDRIKAASLNFGPSRETLFAEGVWALWRMFLEENPALDLERYPGGETYDQAFMRTCQYDIYETPYRVRRIRADDDRNTFSHIFHRHVFLRSRFFITYGGRIGIGCPDTQVDDVIYILSGGDVPFILREHQKDVVARQYTYVGDAYVHGIMDGEAIEDDVQWERITIV
ncbi:hypothetical protein M406DRAFT_323213 [Cryphonectria parasitica EP155]|uniref:Uncharacterized protein n=1 Tax=Cryphonectria parasitica (strain ATCC 38755 / EP155) TaxID=660469 RepID=A0A9P4XZ69_CRYP1|nr:uncharacterized protein M406DRAFT_323213 [Cryphonectria parasitica EP155]KAF3763583.1 hypothetical protein M406DRAFT_323213 [Cryphonectria parasitica EP155]